MSSSLILEKNFIASSILSWSNR